MTGSLSSRLRRKKPSWDYLASRFDLKPEDIDVVLIGGLIFNMIGENEIRYRFSRKNSYRNRERLNRITSVEKARLHDCQGGV